MLYRSSLYVPGDRPDLLVKSLSSGADSVIADLEDAVAPDAKDTALAAVQTWLDTPPSGPQPAIWIRVNAGVRRPHEIAALGAHSRVAGFILAKTQSAQEVDDIAARLDGLNSSAGLVPLLEDARAVMDAAVIATARRVVRLQLGEADLRAQLGIVDSGDGLGLLLMRSQVVLASAAAGIEPPMAPVFTRFRDLAGLRETSRVLRNLGFFGRACIHPGQLAVVNEIFTPTDDEVEQARAALAAHGAGGSAQLGGEFIDEAVARTARRVLSLAERQT